MGGRYLAELTKVSDSIRVCEEEIMTVVALHVADMHHDYLVAYG